MGGGNRTNFETIGNRTIISSCPVVDRVRLNGGQRVMPAREPENGSGQGGNRPPEAGKREIPKLPQA